MFLLIYIKRSQGKLNVKGMAKYLKKASRELSSIGEREIRIMK